MTSTNCGVCDAPIRTMCFIGTGACCGRHLKELHQRVHSVRSSPALLAMGGPFVPPAYTLNATTPFNGYPSANGNGHLSGPIT